MEQIWIRVSGVYPTNKPKIKMFLMEMRDT